MSNIPLDMGALAAGLADLVCEPDFRAYAANERDNEDALQESRLRRRAKRRGLLLVKARTRTRMTVDWGTYLLADRDTGAVVACGLTSGFGLTLEEVADLLSEADALTEGRC